MSPITDYASFLRGTAAEVLEIAEGDHLRPLPSRPGQTVADAMAELSACYEWAAETLEGRAQAPEHDLTVVPDTVLSDFKASLNRLLAVLEEHPPSSPAWTWSPGRDTAAFWHRRCSVITALTLWDLSMASGATVPLDQGIAVAAIDEALDSFLPAGKGLHPVSEAQGLVQLFAQDADRTWFVRFTDGKVAVLSGEPEAGTELQARTAGSASDLALSLHGRLPFGITDTVGDERLLQRIRVE
ncbi:hypothetical protein [Salininema proteolyticum]|uniref:MDMPI C-terminal domain-containing protein n=1 Tax=Salininema proteolyticum TaxID=1607685 RepID=A0ABV8TVR1_9ACTN